MTDFKASETSSEDRYTQRHSSGVRDEKGREIGVLVHTATVTFEAIRPDAVAYTAVEPGRYFSFRPAMTREGKAWGPLQRRRLFPTAAERNAAIEKYLIAAKKRALKLAAA